MYDKNNITDKTEDKNRLLSLWEEEAEMISYSDYLVQGTDAKGDGKWVTHACFFNCGGRCVNRSYVEDGKVIYQKTDDLHEDTRDYPQQRGCARGRALRQMIFGADRLRRRRVPDSLQNVQSIRFCYFHTLPDMNLRNFLWDHLLLYIFDRNKSVL